MQVNESIFGCEIHFPQSPCIKCESQYSLQLRIDVMASISLWIPRRGERALQAQALLKSQICIILILHISLLKLQKNNIILIYMIEIFFFLYIILIKKSQPSPYKNSCSTPLPVESSYWVDIFKETTAEYRWCFNPDNDIVLNMACWQI